MPQRRAGKEPTSMPNDILALFSPACRSWFTRNIGMPTPVQREGWAAIARGGNVLISAPTGTGKTLTAFLWAIDRMLGEAVRGALRDGIRVIYISPLKALGNDIRQNLDRPLRGIAAELGGECPVRAAVRTGDTTPAERRAMLRRPPHILITTPESLFIMLTGERTRGLMHDVDVVIVDELHAVMDSKRGAHLMMTLERLNELCGREVPRIGLSATVKPLALAAEYLAGFGADGAPRACARVCPDIRKRMDLQVELALPDLRVMPEGSIWPAIFRRAYDAASHCRTTLAFCEGRAIAEKLAHGVNGLGGEGFARTHHGCISREQRLEAERQLKSGQLRMMCATSSMELGIDVGEIDLVMQIGAPASVARAAQRLGRAGHRPGEVSRMRFYPRNAQDILLDAFIARGVLDGEIESMRPPRLCLDVVAQQLVAMSVCGEYTLDEALGVLRGAWPARELTRELLERVLCMLAGDYERDDDMPQRPRLIYDRINGVFRGDNYSRLLALRAGGTIPDRGYYGVYLEDGTYLGELDEECVFEARLGDRFLLGAFAWQIVNITRDRVLVRASDAGGAAPPFWRGEGMGRPYDAGRLFGGYMRALEDALARGRLDEALHGFCLDEDARVNLARYISDQARVGLPTDRTLVCEHFSDGAGEYQMLVHSLFGAQVNLPLGLMLQKVAVRLLGGDVRMHYSDDGILLHSTSAPLPEGLIYKIDRANVREELIRLLPAAPLFTMAFRYNSTRALMMGMRGTGRQPLWVQRLRGEQAYARALRHEHHPLLYETMRECLEDYTDCRALIEVLEQVASGEIGVVERNSVLPSPFARGLRGQLEAVEMYNYTPTPTAAGGLDMTGEPELKLAPAQAALDVAQAQAPRAENADRLHELLLSHGDMVAGECDAPLEWLERLCAQRRALYVEPGLWIAAEDEQLYAQALGENTYRNVDGTDMSSPQSGAQTADSAGNAAQSGASDMQTEVCTTKCGDSILNAGAEERGADAADAPTATSANTPLNRILRRCIRWHGQLTADELAERYALDERLVADALASMAAQGEIIATDAGYVHRDVYQRAQRIELRARRERIRTVPPEHYAALLAHSRSASGRTTERLLNNLKPLNELELPVSAWDTVLPALTAGYAARHIDSLVASGDVIWRVTPGKRPLLSFHDPERIDWDADPTASWQGMALSDGERTLLEALKVRGASFISALPRISGALELLTGLCLKGLVTADSLEPLRSAGEATLKRAARRTAAQATRRRWELARPLKPLDVDARLEQAFDRYAIASRETLAQAGLSWGEALSRLRALEYAGLVRRGYFVRGMSGAQFVRADDFERVCLNLARPREDCVALSAIDPLNAWGLLLRHDDGPRGFMRVAGTVVVLHGGAPVLICEQQGRVLRVLDSACAVEALSELKRAFELNQVYPLQSMLRICQYQREYADALEQAGFVREMLDYVVIR